MSVKTIAICSSQVPYVRGGAEILVDELHKQLLKRGFESVIINIPFKWYPKQQLIDSALVWRMTDITESNGKKIDRVICTKYPNYVVNHPDKVLWLFHQHRQMYDLLGGEYSEFKNTPEDLAYINQVKNIDNNTITEAKKVFTISKTVSGRLKKYNDIESTALYPPTKHEEEYYTEDYDDYIFIASRLDSIKRINLIIEAMKYTKTDAKLLIAGKGPHENEYKKLAKKLGLKNKVVFKGFVSDEELLNLYANCFSVFFSPKDEDYGFITIEAFKSKKPVITTVDSGGVLEFVEDGKTGYVVENDPKKIAEKVDYLYNNRNKCRKFGQNAYKKVEEIYWDNVIEQLTKEY
ncbi:glycosyltransferase family 4 protein [Orenia marismortui]|uniref:Glycosyltransferase involved in cell wall biosynthesis n=1 Tax=Orenia marismortui TaxID=46469 RepID=A0A4R8HLK7_9FIRM|nr:glycosyltransferase family 4 protein [Orenia marismortui]TDX59254.1 glycosyltransferase involved in cell wall biosynthesis [Orenia marismortui]